MANFGFSIGDIITVSTLAWKTYKACKDAGDEFKETSQEVLSLHIVIKELGDEVSNSKSLIRLHGKAEILQVLLSGCESSLTGITGIIEKYRSLGSDKKKLKDRIRLAMNDLAGARLKITIHIGALNTFIANVNGAGLARIYRKLDDLVKDLKMGIATGSVASLASNTSDGTELDASWARFKMELYSEGMTKDDVDDKRDFAVAFVSGMMEYDQSESTDPKDNQTERDLKGKGRAKMDDKSRASRGPASEKTDASRQRGIDQATIGQKSMRPNGYKNTSHAVETWLDMSGQSNTLLEHARGNPYQAADKWRQSLETFLSEIPKLRMLNVDIAAKLLETDITAKEVLQIEAHLFDHAELMEDTLENFHMHTELLRRLCRERANQILSKPGADFDGLTRYVENGRHGVRLASPVKNGGSSSGVLIQ